MEYRLFFIEFFSHIHSAEMSSEHSQVYTPFADGWLLYAAYQFYLQKTDLPFADYRRYYAKKYWHDATSLDGNNGGSHHIFCLGVIAGGEGFNQSLCVQLFGGLVAGLPADKSISK